MVPTTLDGWTLEALRKLLVAGAFESDSFDFKEQLPESRNEMRKQGLSADCAAFANARGGFLVFGIKDDRTLTPDDRLVGTDIKDFPEQFGYYPSRCSPTVEWEPKLGGIPLANGKLIHVVQVPKSWQAPHSTELQPGTFRFPKRTNKGTEYMPISEVQAMFLGLQEKRRKLEMLRAELAFVSKVVESIKPANVESEETSTVSPPVEVLQVLIGETFVLLEQNPELLESLNEVRRLALEIEEDHANYERRLLLPATFISAEDQFKHETRNHNAVVHRHCEWMAAAIKKAQEHLKALVT